MGMKQILLSLSFLVAFTQVSLARPKELTAAKIEQLLQVQPVVYEKGSLKGLEINQNTTRPVILLPQYETDQSYFVSQFYNQGKFWIAEIPKAKVKTVIMQLALFPGPLDYSLAHAQYRFLLETPARLYRVKDGVIKTTQTKDMIFTIQAAMPAGKSYELKDAVLGAYKIVGRLINSFDRAALEERASGDVVTQYVLRNMSAQEKNALLYNALRFSTENRMEKNYRAISENCISIAFDLIDNAVGIPRDRVTLTLENLFMNGKSPNEKMALDALTARGLIDDKSRISNY